MKSDRHPCEACLTEKQREMWTDAAEEPANLEQPARQKMQRKGVDAIVANPLEAMESDHVEAIWLGGDSSRAAPGPLSKTDFARWLIAKVEAAATRT